MKIFFCMQFYIHRNYLYRKLMHFSNPKVNLCLFVRFSRVSGKNPFMTSLKHFSLTYDLFTE